MVRVYIYRYVCHVLVTAGMHSARERPHCVRVWSDYSRFLFAGVVDAGGFGAALTPNVRHNFDGVRRNRT